MAGSNESEMQNKRFFTRGPHYYGGEPRRVLTYELDGRTWLTEAVIPDGVKEADMDEVLVNVSLKRHRKHCRLPGIEAANG